MISDVKKIIETNINNFFKPEDRYN